jgi:subtilisin family serine protease
MIEGWEWCITHQNDDPTNPIMVISTSFGGSFYTTNCDWAVPAMTTAAQNAVSAGITLFASSGNDGGTNGMGWPACISHVNSVGAVYDDNVGPHFYSNCSDPTTSPDEVTCYSNSASFLTLFAPSNDAYTTAIGGYRPDFGGTSAACPYAAGSAACLQSAAQFINGSFLTPDEVRSSLTSTGDLITDPKAPDVTKPRINLQAAVNTIGSPNNESLTFTPVTPCRIVDTRIAGGVIPPGGLRSYDVYGDGATIGSQGGNPAGCFSPQGEPRAVHLNVASVPVAGQGNLRLFPFNTPTPNASVVNYRTSAQNISNAVTVKMCFQCTKDVNVQSFAGTTHVVIDVLGYYFEKP